MFMLVSVSYRFYFYPTVYKMLCIKSIKLCELNIMYNGKFVEIVKSYNNTV